MAAETDALSRCKACIDGRRSFLLQGGAGSGKTESLKELLCYIRQTQPQARVVCITHTNAAVAEILDRVGEGYVVSTIHSFLSGLISRYRKNIWDVFPSLFQLEQLEGNDIDHAQYRTLYSKCRRRRYEITGEVSGESVSKREYIRSPDIYVQELNRMIGDLNRQIELKLAEIKPSERLYNETRFNSFRDGTFGHDGLLAIFHALFERHPLLRKIIRDKYEYIFIDEYQDTNEDVLKDFLELPVEKGLTVGLFGDNMQSIYSRDINKLNGHIQSGKLDIIWGGDNYRCSYEVIDLINFLRNDDVEQQVALKRKKDGTMEFEEDRHGSVRIWYTVTDRRPNSKSTAAEKQRYRELLEQAIAKAQEVIGPGARTLLLSNKEIARLNGFPLLHGVFANRYIDAMQEMLPQLRRVQALEAAELCRLFEKKEYNELICRAKANGYGIRTLRDRDALREGLEKLCTDQELSMWEAVRLAMDHKLIQQTEACEFEAKWEERWQTTPRYEAFLRHYADGCTTYSRLHKIWEDLSKDEFEELDSKRKKEQFCRALFSKELKFHEIRRYDAYLEEETAYITMHRTKGTGIRSVIVVMEEYFWTEYDFRTIYDPSAAKPSVRERSEKLIYVACSRAVKDLLCLRILTPDEVDAFKQKFPQAEQIDL